MGKWSSIVKNMITGVREMTLHKTPSGKIYSTINNINFKAFDVVIKV